MAIVLLGEGDFTFAASFEESVYATTYESRDTTLKDYPDIGARLEVIEAAGSQVLFGVDAMKLDTEARLPKARLYRWNCPCPGWAGSMQNALESFFKAAKSTLTDDGAIELLYTKSQTATVMKDLCLAARAHNFSAPKGRPFKAVQGYAGKYCDSSELLDMAEATVWTVQYRGENAGEYIYPLLTSGLTKHVLVEAAAQEWLQPKYGDEVVLSMAGSGTLAIPNSQPTAFILGSCNLPEELVRGISTMRTGEVARFALPAAGNEFQVELVSWTEREDLFGDGSAMKTVLEHGGGWEWMPPHMGYEVSISFQIESLDGRELKTCSEFTYIVGSGALSGLSGKVIDRTLLGMRRKERALIQCTGNCAAMVEGCDLEGVSVGITLHDWRMVVDASVAQDCSLLAKLRRCERTWKTPAPTELVKVVVEFATDGSAPLMGFHGPQTLDGVCIGDSEFCEGFRRVLVHMKLGENALIESSSPDLFHDKRLNISPGNAKHIVVKLLLEPHTEPLADV